MQKRTAVTHCALKSLKPWGMSEKGGREALETFPFQALALQLTGTANGFTPFTGSLFAGLFVGTAELHFTEDAFTLHLLFQHLEGLIDVVVTDEYLHG